MTGYIPAFPSPAPARHPALGVLLFTAQVAGWLALAVVLVLVLMVVCAVRAFVPVLLAGGGRRR
ncbi:hypothetical protein ACFVVA_36750 [Kitasatospora sp. NPDC058048]|uniref:hypothetical protein n=1 Tax=Kitasatospora sp. NPDC058048 TaxID=3346313 RepID=UPI0036DF7D16